MEDTKQQTQIDLKNAVESMSKDHSILKKESRLLGVDDALKTLNKKEYQVLLLIYNQLLLERHYHQSLCVFHYNPLSH